MGDPETYNRTAPVPHNEILLFRTAQNPLNRRNVLVLRRPPPYTVAQVFINSSLSEILTLVITSDRGEVASASADRACHALGLSPNPKLDF